jgi:ATP/maltotriose-dependent transcriptional regulator MalT
MKTAKRVETFAADRVLPLIANESPHPFASPSAPPSHIACGDLVRRLEAALDKKLILVTAPAGYGKTALLRELWDALKDRDCVRVRPAPSGGGDAFAAALVDACVRAELAGPQENASADAMLAALAHRLSAVGRDIAVFIDDNDAAACAEAGRLLKLFLRQAPAHLRVIFAGRTEPACGAAKMRLDGTLAEFTRADLAFTPAETAALFLKEGLAPGASEGLAAKCAGWPAAVGLARLWLREGDSPCQAARFSGALPMVAAYIAQEMLADVPADMLNFLTQTALFAEVDAGLADAALNRRDSDAMLRRLDYCGGLVFPVPGAPGRYRHHPLLTDYFRERLFKTCDRQTTTALRKRAAAYFEQCAQPLDALEHAADAGDAALVRSIARQPSFGFIAMTADRSRFRRLMTYLENAAPDEPNLAPSLTPGHKPDLWPDLRPGWALRRIFEGRPEDAKPLLHAVQSSPAACSAAPSVYAAADTRLIDALYDLYTDTPEAEVTIAGLEKTRGASAMDHPAYEGVLYEALGVFQLRLGRISKADDMLAVAADGYKRLSSPGGAIRAGLHRAMIAIVHGNIAGARGFHDEARRLAANCAANNDPASAAIAIVGATLDYEAAELADAGDASHPASYLLSSARRALVDNGDFTVEFADAAFRMEAQHALISRGLGEAMAIVDLGAEFAHARRLGRLRKSLMVRKVHLAAAGGEIKAAQEQKAELDRCFPLRETNLHLAAGWREDASRALGDIRLEIACGRGERALALLDNFDRTSPAVKFESINLKSAALRALALAATDEPVEAACLLRTLVEKGEASGMRAFFLEEGLAAQALLDATARRFSKTRKAAPFNAALKKWLIASSFFLPKDQRIAAPALTRRQLSILRLLARGLDRSAIAREAETTTHNVQYHLKILFGAFGVSSSLRLVAEAIRLGLVDEIGS